MFGFWRQIRNLDTEVLNVHCAIVAVPDVKVFSIEDRRITIE